MWIHNDPIVPLGRSGVCRSVDGRSGPRRRSVQTPALSTGFHAAPVPNKGLADDDKNDDPGQADGPGQAASRARRADDSGAPAPHLRLIGIVRSPGRDPTNRGTRPRCQSGGRLRLSDVRYPNHPARTRPSRQRRTATEQGARRGSVDPRLRHGDRDVAHSDRPSSSAHRAFPHGSFRAQHRSLTDSATGPSPWVVRQLKGAARQCQRRLNTGPGGSGEY